MPDIFSQEVWFKVFLLSWCKIPTKLNDEAIIISPLLNKTKSLAYSIKSFPPSRVNNGKEGKTQAYVNNKNKNKKTNQSNKKISMAFLRQKNRSI